MCSKEECTAPSFLFIFGEALRLEDAFMVDSFAIYQSKSGLRSTATLTTSLEIAGVSFASPLYNFSSFYASFHVFFYFNFCSRRGRVTRQATLAIGADSRRSHLRVRFYPSAFSPADLLPRDICSVTPVTSCNGCSGAIALRFIFALFSLPI